MTDRVHEGLLVAVLLAFIVAQAVFAAFPGIDLAVSGRFAAGTNGFPWADNAPAAFNHLMRRSAEALVLMMICWWGYGAVTGSLSRNELRAWALVPLSVALSSGAIVNLLLKRHVGRARPSDVAEFGGSADFTPAWQVTDECARNCSFASGEVAMAASIAIAAVVLLWPRFGRSSARIVAVLAAMAYVGVIALLRIGLGRHFLSDTVFSTLISAVVVLALYRLLGIGRARLAFDPKRPLEVVGQWIKARRRHARRWLRRAS